MGIKFLVMYQEVWALVLGPLGNRALEVVELVRVLETAVELMPLDQGVYV